MVVEARNATKQIWNETDESTFRATNTWVAYSAINSETADVVQHAAWDATLEMTWEGLREVIDG